MGEGILRFIFLSGGSPDADQKDGLFLVIFQPGAQYIIFAKQSAHAIPFPAPGTAVIRSERRRLLIYHFFSSSYF
jgi:hypothetical protein